MPAKRLMILGASKNELPAIFAARRQGIETIVVDINPRASAMAYADRAIVAHTKETDEYIAIARREKIDGVMTVACEALVRTVSAVARALGLAGISESTAAVATDKSLMRQTFLEKGIASPRFVTALTMNEAVTKSAALSWPVVIKPVDQAGSRGVVQLRSQLDLVKAFDPAKDISKSGKVIIEEYIHGIESTVDAITVNGKTHILGISDKKHIHSPNIIAMDLAFPPGYGQVKVDAVKRLVVEMLEAVGLRSGASHTEVIVTDKGPVIVEFAARSGGGLIPSDILPHLCGFDVIDALISLALGEDPGIGAVCLRNGVDLRFFKAPAGKLIKIHGVDQALALPGVHKIECIVKEGDTIKPLTEDNDRVGFVITYGKDRGEAVALADVVEKMVTFEVA